jgi:hypothetical protein
MSEPERPLAAEPAERGGKSLEATDFTASQQPNNVVPLQPGPGSQGNILQSIVERSQLTPEQLYG